MLSVTPHLTRNFEHYVLVLPASMKFAPSDARQFQAMNNQPGSNVQVSLKAQAGQNLAYSVSGTGGFPDDSAEDASNAPPGGGGGSGGAAMGGSGATDSRPGGGLGKPIDAPDGLAKYRWYILGLLLTFLIGGGIWTHERTRLEEAEAAAAAPLMQPPLGAHSQTAAGAVSSGATPAASLANQPPAASSVNPSNLLLAALKEELFTLEVERQQGKISPEEYDQARAALEQTLHRALARNRS
jgi:hypothetical protein